MAEFCKDCAVKYLGFTPKQANNAIMSDEPELCEGCGEMKPVVVRIKPTLGKKIRAIFGR